MGTSGFILIPVNPPTQCVAECAKCGVQRASEHGMWGPPMSLVLWVHHPNGPQFKMAVRVTSEHSYARNARARIRVVHVIGLYTCIQRLFDTQANHRTLFGAPRSVRIGICVGIGCAMAVERSIWANEISLCSYVEISALLTYGNGEFARTQNFLRNDLRTPFAFAAEICLQISSACGFKKYLSYMALHVISVFDKV